ncbi:MAG: outer membrane beta-barrel protein [Planctomycetes bacterium]|nr:outer membrane beta-barrel protein [Planctomycetota bacterium]
MANTVLLAILFSASSLLLFLPFMTTAVPAEESWAEDTQDKALYSGDVLLVPPFQDPEEFDMIDGFERGMRELSISVGGSRTLDEPHIYTFTLTPRMGWILATFNWPRGALEFEVEPFVSVVKIPSNSTGDDDSTNAFTQEFGGTIMLGYNFETGTKLVPFVHAGAGAMQAGDKMLKVKEKGTSGKNLLKTRINAVAQVGLGVKYFIRKRTSLNLETRFRHVSNPTEDDKETDDAGFNSLFLLVGLSYFY